jgi:hypothetical protein
VIREFQRAVLDDLAAGPGEAARVDAFLATPLDRARFAVHRNNTLASLELVLGAAFPVVRRLVGDAFFRKASWDFVRAHPPAAPRLYAYGGGFGPFLAAYAPAASEPYLGDVAALEWARTEAYFAADATPLAPSALEGIAREDYAALRFVLHPSARLVCSDCPILAIWQANQPEEEDPAPPDLERDGERVLVLRPALTVGSAALSPGDATLLAAMMAGRTLVEAAEAAVRVEPGLDLEGALAAHLGRGTFTGFRPS